ncbi:hypothetical protein SEA_MARCOLIUSPRIME_86 [Mycobacterium phage Marcoliusprime]|uniref:Uncharacterized protein n=1 Tax=Mycobacterium phage Findley TaxID=2015882 RepID=A0A222ZQ17_9CAUD|nr:hypothetical protein MILLY_87 [Mycobacterium phage Milly]YP_009951173.1 hypothetical protein I5G77_gp87 [Mycobacterium phage Findley]AOZ64423.1 hypothetical protein SEA_MARCOLIUSPRIME_86 [Mycobacterium phage Marcoliusprime]ASR86629.1 hypothetical protein SEA_DISMALFUNK_87 [Mycobacterium phage DismalFunk]AYB69039.1 hypothetical protein SEA_DISMALSTRESSOR_87 [Mycobacterium phage DismalStressor]AJA43759.1 hypothetical protein MILLY_87 [Mycobacterium phage Milly]ASR86826.1 hypothetical protein
MMLEWTENAHREHVANHGGYVITRGWKLPDVPRWEVHVTSPELGPGEGGLGVLRYIGSRDTLDEAKAFAQADYDGRYAI